MTQTKAKARVLPVDGRTKIEIEWADSGEMALAKHAEVITVDMKYEPITFKTGELRYTPDFMHVDIFGAIIFVEVKASEKQRGFQYSLARLKATAAAFPWFYFYLAIKREGAWRIKLIKS